MAELEDLSAGKEVMSEDAERPTSPDIYCDPCLQDDERQHAEGFCVDCNEYLCLNCFKAHRKSKTSKSHQLKSRAEMPVTKPVTETCEEKCIEHNRELEFYCESHDQVFCEICKHTDHRTCENIRTIDSLNEEASSDREQWIVELNDIEDQLNANKMILERHKNSVEFYYKQATRSIRQIADGNKVMLRAIETACDSVGPGIVTLKRDISKPDSEVASPFLFRHKQKSQMNALKKRLESVKNDNKITRYWYRPSDSADKIGFVVKYPSQDNKLQVKTETDTVDCTITAIVPLSATKLIIADRANSKLNVFDKKSNKISTELKVDKQPWDLTMIDENIVAMTTGDGKEIQVIYLSEQINEPRKIERNDFQSCKGIVFNKDSLVVSHSYPNAIQMLDLDGKPKYTINLHDRNGPIKTGNIECLAKSHVATHLYLPDTTSNEMLCVSLDGFVNTRFKHSQLSSARGITSGRDGRVFVCSCRHVYCGHYTNVIFELNSDLSSGEVIHQETDTATQQSIFYDDMEHKLYVGCSYKDELLVFLV